MRKKPVTGKIWFLEEQTEPFTSRLVFTVGHDEKTHQKRLEEYVGPQEIRVSLIHDEILALGVAEVQPTYNLNPLQMLQNAEMYEKFVEARNEIERSMKDKNELITEEDLSKTCPESDPWGFALAIQWMVEEKWFVRSYRLKKLKDGKLFSDRYDCIDKIPDDVLENGKIVTIKELDLVTELLKTCLFGKKE